MFMTWLHTECGYTFTGSDGVYALTYSEMRLLSDGFEVMKEQSEMDERGVSQHEQAAFRDFASGVNQGDESPGAVP